MSRLKTFFLAALIFSLTGCSGPSVIAYSRGLYFEQLAEGEFRSRQELTTAAIKNYENAIEQYNSAVHFQPKYTECFHHRGLCYRRLEKYSEAAKDLSEAIALEPGNWETWRDRAFNYVGDGKIEPALSDFTEALHINPKSDSVLAARAHCQQLLQKYDQAIADASQAIRLNAAAQNYCCRAGVYRAMREYPKMFADYKAAIKASPHSAETYEEKAYGDLNAGLDHEAYQGFIAALHLSRWKQKPAYSVITACMACMEEGVDGSSLLDQGVEVLGIPVATADGAQDAVPSQHWPEPAIQYFHGDITQATLLALAKGNRNRMTEVNTYLAYENLYHDKLPQAKNLLRWVAENGNHDFYEYELAVSKLARMADE